MKYAKEATIAKKNEKPVTGNVNQWEAQTLIGITEMKEGLETLGQTNYMQI